MTTLWARMLVIEEYKNGKITKECAQYFDELLDEHRFFNMKTDVLDFCYFISKNKVEYPKFNGNTIYCTLGNIGRNSFSFDVMKYLKATTFKGGLIRKEGIVTHYGDPAYLSEIIGEEYANLTLELDRYIKDSNPSESDLLFIQKYLKAKTPTETYTYLLEKIDTKLNALETNEDLTVNCSE